MNIMDTVTHRLKVVARSLSIGQDKRGFTIIESMIVLAVSGLLLSSLTVIISGKQHKAGFSQAVATFSSQIEQTISDVQSGFYPYPAGKLSCSASGSPLVPTINPGANDQGTNNQCIFLGKLLRFQKDMDSYKIYVLAGLSSATDFASSQPNLVDNGGAENATVTKHIPNGLMVKSVKYSGSHKSPAVAIVTNFSTANSTTTGSQSTQIIPMPDTSFLTINDALSNTVAKYRIADLAGAPIDPTGGVTICLSDDTGYYANVTIGAASGSTTTSSDSVQTQINSGSCP